jgi:hypothetical protein
MIDPENASPYAWSMEKLLLRSAVLGLALAMSSLSSCGAARSLIQMPARTLKSVGRSVGLGIEATEPIKKSSNKEQESR